MLLLPLFFRRRKRREIRQPLQLMFANYQDGDSQLVLTFDRAIDITGFDGTQVTVQDGQFANANLDGTGGASQPDENSIQIELHQLSPNTSGITVMNASAVTGIVAVDDGGTWAGVVDDPIG